MKNLFIIISLCILMAIGSHADTPIVSPESIFYTPEDSDFTFSPDGRYVAYVKELRSTYYLYVIDIDKRELTYKTKILQGYPKDISWLSNRRVMYENDGRLFSMNIDGTESRVLIDYITDYKKVKSRFAYERQLRFWDILDTLPDNKEEILLQSKNKKGIASVELVNIYTGNRTLIASGKSNNISDWYTDLHGNVILGISHKKGKTTTYLNVSKKNKNDLSDTHKNREFKKHSEISQHTSNKIATDAKSFINSKIEIQSGSFDPDIVYISDATESNNFRLSTFSISQNKVLEVIYEDNTYDIGSQNNDINLHFLTEDKKLLGFSYEASKIKTIWLDDRLKKIQKSIDEKYPDSNNQIYSWTNKLSKFLIYMESSDHYGKVYIYESDTKNMVQLADYSLVLEGARLPVMKAIEYTSKDNTKHESYLTLPLGHKTDTKIPFVILVHGGPWARYMWGYDPESLYFASRGYGVIRVNFRGSTGYGRDYMTAGLKNISTVMIDDIADGAQWAIDNNLADPQRIYIMGTSYGGYAALLSLVKKPNLYAAASSLAAPLDIPKQIKDYKKNKQYFAYEYWNYAVGDIKRDKKLLNKISPINLINQIEAPFQIFHGDNDPIVNVDQVKSFEKKMKNIGKKDKIRIIKNEGHGLYHQSNQVYYMESAEELFSKNRLNLNNK